jgi:hypothetical protein
MWVLRASCSRLASDFSTVQFGQRRRKKGQGKEEILITPFGQIEDREERSAMPCSVRWGAVADQTFFRVLMC